MEQAELDSYRERYAELDYDSHRDFYARIAQAFPDQRHASASLADEFLRWCKPKSVIELGGWDGELAQAMLERHPEIERWVNYEIAPVDPVCSDERYRQVSEGWAWEQELQADAFIASHVLEHLSAEHLDALLEALECEHAYVDVPLPDEATDWQSDPSTHVLPLSIGEFDERWRSAGFQVVEERERPGGYYGRSSVRFLSKSAAKVKQHPPGTIVIAAGEFLRYGAFVNSMLQVLHPPGTSILIRQGLAVVENLNDCIRKMTGDWIWIQADDQSWHPDALVKLLDREVDVVVPLILKRNPPYYPVAFKDYVPGSGFMPYALHELPEKGLMPVEAAGSGGMLVRKRVLDALGDPWFTYGDGELLNEDLMFCRRVVEAGFQIWLDVEVQMGHRGNYTVLPVHEEGRWGIGLNMGTSSNGKSNTIVLHPNDLVKEEEA